MKIVKSKDYWKCDNCNKKIVKNSYYLNYSPNQQICLDCIIPFLNTTYKQHQELRKYFHFLDKLNFKLLQIIKIKKQYEKKENYYKGVNIIAKLKDENK